MLSIRVKNKKLQAEAGEVKRSSHLCFLILLLKEKKVVGDYENNYIDYYRCSSIF